MKHFLLGVLFLVLSVPGFAKEINVRTNPLYLVNLEVDIPVATSWTLGPTTQYVNRTMDDFKVKAWSLGLRGNYWFNGDVYTQGWYFGPSVGFLNVKVTDEDPLYGNEEGTATAFTASAYGGYHWVWESFNIMLGAGPVFYSAGSITVKDSAGNKRDYNGYSGGGLGIEFALGWKF